MHFYTLTGRWKNNYCFKLLWGWRWKGTLSTAHLFAISFKFLWRPGCWKGLQIFCSILSENFIFSFLLLWNSKNDHLVVEKVKSLSKYCRAAFGKASGTKFLVQAKVQNSGFRKISNFIFCGSSVALNMIWVLRANETFQIQAFSEILNSMGSGPSKVWKYIFWDIHGENVVDKFAQLSKTGFSLECFLAIFLQIFAACFWQCFRITVKI